MLSILIYYTPLPAVARDTLYGISNLMLSGCQNNSQNRSLSVYPLADKYGILPSAGFPIVVALYSRPSDRHPFTTPYTYRS